jgi:glycine cleavage system H protein
MMAETLTFLMGKFAAELPGDLRYARNHLWARPDGRLPPGGAWRFGFTTYAVRLMQDVYFLSWSIDAGDDVTLLQEIGHIETSKAESDLFAPLAGRLERFNEQLLKDPSAINVECYGAGWLFELSGEAGGLLMDAEQYRQYLSDNWEKTQRLIKGKINEE